MGHFSFSGPSVSDSRPKYASIGDLNHSTDVGSEEIQTIKLRQMQLLLMQMQSRIHELQNQQPATKQYTYEDLGVFAIKEKKMWTKDNNTTLEFQQTRKSSKVLLPSLTDLSK